MTLRKKTLLVIGVTILCSLVMLYAAATIVLTSGFITIEEQNTRQDVERALAALSDELNTMSSMTRDYASWDDTYAFIEDANDEYAQVNLVDETFTNLGLNAMAFVNTSGRVVFRKTFDLQNESETPFPESLNRHLAPGALLLQHVEPESSMTGIVLLPEGPMLVASRPILTSEYEGPIRGTLIFGRYLDSLEIEQLAAKTHLSLVVHRFDAPELPFDFQTAQASLSEETPLLVRPLDSQFIAGYALLKDIYQQPALLLRVDGLRTIYQQGQATLRYFLVSLLAVAVVVGAVALLLSERLILLRMARLSAEVNGIGTRGDLAARVSLAGRDELASLAGAINEMLASLEQAEHDRQESQALYESERYTRYLASQLQAVAEVSHTATTLLDPEQLIRQVVELIQVRFGFYYVGLFLLDEQNRYAVLQHGTGEAGRIMKERRHRLDVGGQSIVGWVSTNKQARIAIDTRDDPLGSANPLLPDTRSEIVLPLQVGGHIRGVLDVHSARAATFDEGDINVLQNMADQVAMALENARLFQQTQAALEEMEAANRLLTRQGWQGYLRQLQTSRRAEFGVAPDSITNQPTTVPGTAEPSAQPLVVPLELRGQSIGRLALVREGGRAWSKDEIDMVEAVALQTALAADNARLLDEIQRRAARERLASQVTARVRETLDVDRVLQTAVREMRATLNLAEAEVRMGAEFLSEAAQEPTQSPNGHD